MRVLVIEDEEVVSRRLARLVNDALGDRLGALECAATVGEAARQLAVAPFDLIFLDLDLYGQDGFDLVRRGLADGGRVVVVSAHRERALEGFEEGVVDFVAKPFDRARLRRAIERALPRAPVREGEGVRDGGGSGRPRLAVRRGGRIRFVPVAELVFVTGAGDYSRLVLADGSEHLHQQTLASLESSLPGRFQRVHRSYLVDLQRVEGVRSLRGSRYRLELQGGRELPVSRTRVRDLRQRLSEL
jgi:DNA-binding LytR/AlgR family response regulator